MTNDNDTENVFKKAMKGVTPLKTGKNKVYTKYRTTEAKVTEPTCVQAIIDEDIVPIDGEIVIGCNKSNIPKKYYQRLCHGEMNTSKKLDLHTLTISESYHALHDFIESMMRAEIRSGLIVHGKGKGIIKAVTKQYLDDTDDVLAYHSALKKDGGTGAVYILLRKPR